MQRQCGNRPHILLLYCDQMQHDRLGFVDGVAHTPHLDALAAESVHFTHAITQQGQCVPSRAVLWTGQSAHECGVMVNYGFFGHQNMLTRRHQTLAKVLRNAGYTTAYFGKGHLGAPLADLGFTHGQVYDAETTNAGGGTPLDAEDTRRLGCDYVPSSIASDYSATEDAVAFLNDWQPGENPLCFTLSLHFPHPPFFSERRFIARFTPDELKLPESYYTETFEGKPPFQQAHLHGHSAFDVKAQQRELADYYSMIAAMDDHMGLVIAEFKRLGIWENTIVLFTSDHGDMMGAHRMRLKGTLPYDEIYRVPCIIKLPAGHIATRRVVDDLVSSQAYAGTLLDLAGLPVPKSFTGGSFADAFQRERHSDDEAVFFEHYCAYWGLHPFYGVRTRRMKYVRYYGADATEELYDLQQDPHELRNVAVNPRYAQEKARMARQADTWWRDTGGNTVEYYESADFKANKHNFVELDNHTHTR